MELSRHRILSSPRPCEVSLPDLANRPTGRPPLGVPRPPALRHPNRLRELKYNGSWLVGATGSSDGRENL